MRQVCPDRHVAPFGEFRPLVHGLARVAAVGLVEPDVVVGREDDVRPDVLESHLRELAVPGGQRDDGDVRDADPEALCLGRLQVDHLARVHRQHVQHHYVHPVAHRVQPRLEAEVLSEAADVLSRDGLPLAPDVVVAV